MPTQLIAQPPRVVEVFWAPPPVAKSSILRLQQAPEGSTAAALECAVMRPQDLSLTHGHEVRLDNLQEMVESYNPAIQVATLNFDHAWGGPAHGWCDRVWLEGELFMARWVDLSQEAIDGIQSKRWFRQSGEITMHHPATAGWYFEGMALLGARAPAIWGLPPVRYEPQRFALKPGAEPPTSTTGEPVEEVTVPQESTTRAAVPAAATITHAGPAAVAPLAVPAPAAPAQPPPSTPDAATELAALQQARTELAAETHAARSERLAARRERVTGEVAAAILQLGRRVSPGMLRAGLREMLIELRAADAQPSVKLTLAKRGGGTESVDRSAYDVFLAVLAAAPEFAALDAGEIAVSDDGAALAQDDRDPATRAYHLSRGLTDERYMQQRLRRSGLPVPPPQPDVKVN